MRQYVIFNQHASTRQWRNFEGGITDSFEGTNAHMGSDIDIQVTSNRVECLSNERRAVKQVLTHILLLIDVIFGWNPLKLCVSKTRETSECDVYSPCTG